MTPSWPDIVAATLTFLAAAWCLTLASRSSRLDDKARSKKYVMFSAAWVGATFLVFAIGFFA
jgi:hypothetical protein